MRQQLTSIGAGQERRGSLDEMLKRALKPGMILLWPAATPPKGWFELNGQTVKRLELSAVFSIIGDTYGAGDGSTTFELPDWSADAPAGGMYIIRA